MGEIRKFEEAHVPEVAALELKIFHGRPQPAGPALCKYFNEIFLRNPWREDDMPSLVYIHNNRIAGFVGVIPRRMLFRNRPVRVAVASQLMVDREQCRGFAGLELMRRLFAGPQDLTFTDGATEAAHAVWTAAGARAARLYSLQWKRLLRPMAYYRGLLERRPATGAALRAVTKASAPVGALIDAGLAKLPFRALSAPQSELRAGPVDGDELLSCIREIGWRDALKPCYEAESFRWLLAQASTARRHGALRMAVAREPQGRPAGWFVYFAKRGGESTVLQIGAVERHFEQVFLALLRDGWEAGATALAGQAIPRALLALSRRHCSFQYIGNGVLAHSRDPELLGCVLEGEAALTRLDGEWWTRFAVEDWS